MAGEIKTLAELYLENVALAATDPALPGAGQSQVYVKEVAPGIFRLVGLDENGGSILNFDQVAFDAVDDAGAQQFTSGIGVYDDFVWPAQVENTGEFTFTPGQAEIAITANTVLYVSFSITLDELAGNNRSDWGCRFMRDAGGGFVEVVGWRGFVYSRNSGNGIGTITKARVLRVSAGDIVKVQVARNEAPNTYQSVSGGSSISMAALGGPKGDKGEQGDPGVGSAIIVKDEGGVVAGGPHTALNFTGNLVEASDEGGGQAKVDVSFGFPFYNEDEGESTRTATSYTQKLRLTFTAQAADYMLDWSYEYRSDEGEKPTNVRVQLDDSETLWDVGEESEKGKNDYSGRSGFCRRALTAGGHNLDLDFASGKSGKTVRIRRVRLRAWKAST
jgi:hypothetical protein